MMRFLTTTSLALVTCLGMTLASVTDAEAQRAPRGGDSAPAPAEGRQFSAANGEAVSNAQELMKSGSYGAAISALNGALGGQLNAYERSIIHQMLGSSYYEQNNFAQAIQNFESAISSGGLLPNEADQLRVNIAQLLIGNGQFARGAQMLEDYLRRGGTPNPKYDEYIMQAWVQSENYSRALPYAEKWFRNSSPRERKHYDLLNFLYNNLNMPGKQADIVKEMINRWPNDKQLWDAWASMLATGGREQEAFEVTKMLYIGGALNSEQDLSKVVQYYSFYDMPYQAAQILQKEMNAGRLPRTTERMVQLSNLLRQAREYKAAIPVLEQAASQAGTSKLYADLGEALYNEGQCDKAESAFKQAISKGYDAGKSWFFIGECRYKQAQAIERPSCQVVDAGNLASTEWAKARDYAVDAFRQIPGNSRQGSGAREWAEFVKNDASGLVKRCEHEGTVERDLCFVIIEAAYENEVFAGGFKLEGDDAKCEAFKAEFDSKYRRAK